MIKKSLLPVVKAMLEDAEFLAGGVFSKEKYYMDKYKLTSNQIGEIATHLYFALHIKDGYEGRLK